MGIKRLEDLVALQLATEFKREVYRLVRASRGANGDFKFRDQLFDAASSVEANATEGWHRYLARDFALFLRYALASLGEARRRLHDGIDRGHFTDADCQACFVLADRCGAAVMNLHKSLRPFTGKKGRSQKPRPSGP